MKNSVSYLLKKFGEPPEKETTLTQSEQEIVKAILDGCTTFEEIGKKIGKTRTAIKALIFKMYCLAESDGVVYTNKRFKLPVFCQWVRGEYEIN